MYHALIEQACEQVELENGAFRRYLRGEASDEESFAIKEALRYQPGFQLEGLTIPGPQDPDFPRVLEVLQHLRRLHFINCRFQTRTLALEYTGDDRDACCGFEACTFETDWVVTDLPALPVGEGAMHQGCTFHGQVTICGELSHFYYISEDALPAFAACAFLQGQGKRMKNRSTTGFVALYQ